MMDLETMRAVNARAQRAARGNVPATWKGERIGFKIPFLGERVPRGWRRTDREALFVDSSGMGAPGEPALTQEEMFAALTIGKAYAVIESGQFQLYVGEYERT